MPVVSASRTARAESRYREQEREAERAEQATALRYAREHEQSEGRAQRERMAVATPWPSLLGAIGWFKRQWLDGLPASLHRSGGHVEPDDTAGTPELTGRWRAYIARMDDLLEREPEPIRDAIRYMATGPNRYDRLGARYLFALACADFEPVKAGWEMRGVCVCLTAEEHALAPCPAMPISDEYSPWYAERAIERLRQVVMKRAQRRPGRVISEAQAEAEAAA